MKQSDNNDKFDEYGYSKIETKLENLSDMDALLIEKTREYMDFLDTLGISVFTEVQSPTQPSKFYSFSALRKRKSPEEDLAELSLLMSVVSGHISKLTRGNFIVGPIKFFHPDEYEDNDDFLDEEDSE